MENESKKNGVTGGDINVGCLMLTLAVPDRLPFAKRSIDDYCRQTLANKVLFLIINGGTESVQKELREYAESLGRDDIRVFTLPAGMNLGQLRNYSLKIAAGDVLCQWDDDDLYHPDRLEKQLARLVEGSFEAVYLQEIMQYFPFAKTLYWTNWRGTEAGGHPGTLMFRREVLVKYPTQGGEAHLGEDLQVARDLIARGKVGYLAGMPHLFVYVSHGKNSWHDGHHQMLADKLSISQALLRRREAQIREGLAPHEFTRDSVSLLGSNGLAFTL
jgi:glycosyltransferase involved in cell wall biosynthesis